ncbi:Shikimate O-hydroxycinnamoyltransferase [Citrus sinensis]|nr:Shikimate O-hydroxycinnamoyltransferase [Citrus sinensis]
MIQPAQDTPKHCLRMSVLDLLMPSEHIPAVYFYRRPNGSSKFFEAGLLKEALSKVLVAFYPLAGRLTKDENGRTEIRCNGEGVLFVEAQANCVIDDFGDFESSLKLMQLVPTVDDTKDASFYPLFMTQVTHFKCGGVCIGVMTYHTLIDGTATYHFIKSWAEMTRGIPVTIPPFFDRTILDVGVPKSPAFHHIEYDPPPSMNDPTQNPGTISTAILKLSLDQMKILKEKSKKDHESATKYTRFEIVAAHIWRCVCKARGLSVDQATKLDIPTSGRFKLNPKIPCEYWGNVVFSTTPIALAGDIQSESLNYSTERIHKALKLMDDKYMKSALAFLKQQPDLKVFMRDAKTFNCPNLVITKLADMPMYDVNFGWGPPFLTRPVNANMDGEVCILPSPNDDGGWSVVIDLETNHLQLFKKLFYGIFP